MTTTVDLAGVDPGQPEPKLRVDKFADGPITCLKLAGTIDEAFDGKRLAGTVKAGTLILDLGEVRKISSFGIREWVDFVGAAGELVGELYFVECAPKVVDQLNMVMNFAGKGRVFSFYAPYRCDYCDVEKRVLLQVDRDHDAIRTMKPPERPCETCGNPAYFDEDPATFFSYLAGQPRFELEADVAAFLSARLSYAVEGAPRRFRAEKQIEGRSTYVRLSGDLDVSFPTAKVAEGLEGVVVVDLAGVGKIDPAGAAAWRAFISVISPTCEEVWLVGCPPVFLERLARAEDLGRAQVVSFSMPYTCQRCAATAAHTLDVETHHDVLKYATAPEVPCPDCGGPTRCAATETLLAHVATLSPVARPVVPPALRAFIAAAQSRKAAPAKAAAPAPTAPPRGLFTILVASSAAAVVALLVVFAWTWLRARSAGVAPDAIGALVQRSAPARPAWITADTRGFGHCADAGPKLSCLGVSSYASSAEDARVEAADAALEALVERAAAGVTDPEWRRLVAALYAPARTRALAQPKVAEARRAIVDALRRTAANVPAQPAAEYWERYEAGPGEGAGTRTLAFVRFDIDAAELEALRARYTTPAEALGARAWTVFPALAWRDANLRGGAELAAVEAGPLRTAGLAAQDVVLEVEGRPVVDAASFAVTVRAEHDRIAQTGGALRLTVKSGDGPPRAFSVAIPKAPATKAPAPPRADDEPAPRRGDGAGTGGVNVWDRTGGGSARDNPNQ